MQERLEKQISFRVTKSDYTIVERAAALANMTIADYVRTSAMGKNVVVIDRSAQILQEVAQLSTLLNLEKINHSHERILEAESRCTNLWRLLK